MLLAQLLRRLKQADWGAAWVTHETLCRQQKKNPAVFSSNKLPCGVTYKLTFQNNNKDVCISSASPEVPLDIWAPGKTFESAEATLKMLLAITC